MPSTEERAGADAYCARWTFQSNMTFESKTKTKTKKKKNREMCQHRKSNMTISMHTQNFEYCEKLAKFGSSFKNLAQEISIWR